MGYDIYFLKRAAGQSWDEAMDVAEERADGLEVRERPAEWSRVVAGVRGVLGDVVVSERPPAWDIEHAGCGLEVSCYSGEWSVSVPYWSSGGAARGLARSLRAIVEIVESVSGLEAYDAQVGEAVTGGVWTDEAAASVFDQVAADFASRGVGSPTSGGEAALLGRDGLGASRG